MTRKIRVEVPLRLVGTPVGVSQQGGILDHLLRSVEIECWPDDIPEELTVDVSHLEVGRHLSVADIPVDRERIRIRTAPDVPVATVSMPKAEEVAETAAATEAAAAEPEVLTARKPEESAQAAPQVAVAEKKAAVKPAKEKKE